ncbi:hypothetical protein PTTG_07602 [Puccinia triticina 1-1 BBBD Race 1]|uniref:Uncharacterized protein n=1 Tax=Puccinia triticina (isolate 1-1 / race 1 (BBBD)) TaxID=630390 RepID=A0A0C4F3C3_PUCT1|nr:hypothetical protein PTTG_07602 [Puccinia triticina 1-1 BBBD Race 1]
MSLPTTHLQLNEAGRSLGIKNLLNLCNVPKEDPLSHGLIKLSHINLWDYFLDLSSHKLEKLKFPHPLASQLMKGARWSIPTHTITDDDVASPKKERGRPVETPTNTGTPDGPLVGLTSRSTSVKAVFTTPATPFSLHGPSKPARCGVQSGTRLVSSQNGVAREGSQGTWRINPQERNGAQELFLPM